MTHWTYHAPTMEELHDKMTMGIVTATEDELDYISSVDVHRHNVQAYAERMVFDFDFKHLWLTPSRWTMMIRQYLNTMEVENWLGLVEEVGEDGRGIAVARTNTVERKGEEGTGKVSRKWGSCMLALSYKAVPRPQITLYSRTSYLGYLSSMDIGVAWVAARHAAGVLGLNVEDFAFQWYNEATQVHYFKSIAWLLNHPDKGDLFYHLIINPDEDLTEKQRAYINSRPAIKGSRRWMQKRVVAMNTAEGTTYADTKYNTFRRVWRRFNTEIMGYEYAQQFDDESGKTKFRAYKPLPSTMLSDLDFRKIEIEPTWEESEDE